MAQTHIPPMQPAGDGESVGCIPCGGMSVLTKYNTKKLKERMARSINLRCAYDQ